MRFEIYNQSALRLKIRGTLGHLWSKTLDVVERTLKWLAVKSRGEKIILALLVIGLPFLVFYNLGLNPRPWHDEGGALTLARTLAEDGVYAIRNSDGYQTFGPVQSVGPTVILPVALAFRLLGVGLVQGRMVAVSYLLITLLLFYLVGRKLFDGWSAIMGVIFLLAAPAVRIFIFGREVLGEVPGLAWFLAGWLVLASTLQSRRWALAGLAGLLFGAAIVTKSQYLVMIPVMLGLVIAIDLVYYRQGAWKSLTLAAVLALACFAAWQVWQRLYFGAEIYQMDLAKLSTLAAVTTGFHLQTAISGVRGVLGGDSGNFYLYWGLAGLAYASFLAAQRNLRGLIMATMVVFIIVWLMYYILWTVPWPHYALPAMALVALLVGHVYIRLAHTAVPAAWGYVLRLSTNAIPTPSEVLALGTVVGLMSYGLWAGFSLQQYLRSDVFDRTGAAAADLRSPALLQAPGMTAEYLKQNIPTGSVIETWERELGIITNLRYHYPDQSYLAKTHAYLYRGGGGDYRLGRAYFDQVKPDYVVISWYARSVPIYDMEYITEHAELVQRIGDGAYSYEIYHIEK